MKGLLASARAAGLDGDDAARVAGLASEPVWRATTLRLERLPEGARAMAHAVAVLGRDATAARAAAVAGLDHFTGLEAAGRAPARGDPRLLPVHAALPARAS